MAPTIDLANSGDFGRRMKLACSSCKYSSSIVLLGAGSLVMTLATVLLGVQGGMLWTHGWPARIIGVVIFCTAPFVVTNVVRDYHDAHDEQSVVNRRSWAGASLLGLGALELVLAIGEFALVWAFASLRNH